MKEPYFKNVPNLDNLYIYFIIFEYDCPILFVCKNKKEELFICVCYDIRKTQKWIVSPIDKNSLIKLLKNEMYIRDAFNSYKKDDKRFLVEYNNIDGKDFYNCDMVIFEDIPDDILPVSNEKIDSEYGEYNNIIKSLC